MALRKVGNGIQTLYGQLTVSAPSPGGTGVTINAGAAPGLDINASANAYGLRIFGSSTASQSLGLIIKAGTNSSDFALAVQNQAAATMMNINGAGNVLINAPAGGVGLTVTAVSGGNLSGLVVIGSPGAAPATADAGRILTISNSSTAGADIRLLDIGQVGANAFLRPVLAGAGPTSPGLQIVTSGGGTTFSSAGNVTIISPTSGTALTVASASGLIAISATITGTGVGLVVNGPAATFSNALSLTQSGQSNWVLQFIASTNNMKFTTGGADNFTWTGGGGVQIGAPTGGDQGAGTLNATGLFINGVSIGGGGFTLKAVKIADQSQTSNAAYTTDNTLTFALSAGKYYYITGVISIVDAGGAGGGGFRGAFNYTGTGGTISASYLSPFITTGGTLGVVATTTSNSQILFTGNQLTPGGMYSIQASVYGGSIGGTLQFQWAQQTSNASALTVKADSFLAAQQLN